MLAKVARALALEQQEEMVRIDEAAAAEQERVATAIRAQPAPQEPPPAGAAARPPLHRAQGRGLPEHCLITEVGEDRAQSKAEWRKGG